MDFSPTIRTQKIVSGKVCLLSLEKTTFCRSVCVSFRIYRLQTVCQMVCVWSAFDLNHLLAQRSYWMCFFIRLALYICINAYLALCSVDIMPSLDFNSPNFVAGYL